MSFKSSSLILGLILGIIVGLVGTYFYFNSQIQDYSTQITELTDNLDKTDSDLSDFISTHNQLTEEYDDLENDFISIQSEKNILEIDYAELEQNYLEILDDYELLVASLPLSPQQLSGTTLEMDYEWYYKGKSYELALSIPETQYTYYSDLPRIQDSDYSVYVTHPYDDEFINTIIRKFNFIALEEHLTEEEKINLVISFVQSLPYTVDSVTTSFDEYPRYPLETLIENGGDCEDTSILTASLLKSMNYDLILISPPAHMAVGVNVDATGTYWDYDGERYYFLETTGEGWEIGEYPDDLEDTAYLYELSPIPMCIHNWTAAWNGRDKMDVTITATNVGSAIAENIQLYASLDAGDDLIWNEEVSDFFSLGVGNSVTITLTLDIPINEFTRLIVGIADFEGYYIDQTFSEWFDT